jgi:hypothetical protein
LTPQDLQLIHKVSKVVQNLLRSEIKIFEKNQSGCLRIEEISHLLSFLV